MTDSEARLDALQQRLMAALERIGQGVEGLDIPQPEVPNFDPAEIEALIQALEDERVVNAQLEERIRALRQRQDEVTAAAQKVQADQRAAMAKLDEDFQRMKAANAQLRENNQALRAANEAGVGEPQLINQAMVAELEALRAARAAEKSEAAAIVAALSPLVTNGAASTAKGDS